MQSEALFNMGQARVMMAVAGAMFAALALRLAWRMVAGEARRHGTAKVAMLLLMSAPLAFWAGGKGGLNCGIMELCNYGNVGLNISTNSPRTIPHWIMAVCTIPQFHNQKMIGGYSFSA